MRIFSVAYVLLPISDTPAAEAIQASLAPFQRGGRGDLPEDRLAFDDETDALRAIHEATLTFTLGNGAGLRIEGGGHDAVWLLDTRAVRDAMNEHGRAPWRVRFADTLTLDAFAERYAERGLERHPTTGGWVRWLNPLRRWDWWDLGGRFDGRIIGDERRAKARRVANVSSEPNRGRDLVANIEDALNDVLGQEPAGEIEVFNDRNVELVETLLADAKADRDHAFPGALVLPPGSMDDRLRWLRAWPELEPAETLARLGLPGEADWIAVVRAAYARHKDHWAAGVAYHL